MFSTRRRLQLLFVSILLLCTSAACRLQAAAAPTPPVTAAQSPQPQSSASASTSTQSPDETSSPTSGGACSVQDQSQALLAQDIPDYAKLPPLTCYDLTLNLSIENDPARFGGTAQVTYTNSTGSDLSDLVFRLYPNSKLIYGGRLEITAASIDSAPVTPEVFLDDRTAVRIDLPAPLAPGETVSVRMDFVGQAPKDFASPSTYGIFNYSTREPVLTVANGYPILAHWENGGWQAEPVEQNGDAVTSDVSFYHVSMSFPNDWKVASTGEQVSGAGTDGGQAEFVSGPVRDFIFVASPAFEQQEKDEQGIQVVYWSLPGTSNNTTMQTALDSIEIYTSRFGPYPYQELDIVDVPLQLASGVEYPGLVLIESTLNRTGQGRQFLPVVVSHEVAHQWWYGVVGNDVRQDPWQDEALATFSSLLYFEEHSPRAFQANVQGYEQSVQEYEKGKGESPVAQPVPAFTNNERGYSTIVYLKGALFFLAVRDRIGEDEFYSALQSYYKSGMYRIVPPDDLLSAFERSCSCDLSDLYTQWGVIP